ncbi:MAG: hypothetical protein JO215_15890 [Ktedonobacteraceae bacterium]|nr:hypothetical protein [Ktedonobacteraceae bacterium]
MDVLKQVKDILEQQNPQEKDNLLEQLSDMFEYRVELNVNVIMEAVQLLLTAALQEKNYSVKEAFFYALNSAIVHYQDKDMGARIDWDLLVASLPSLEKQLLDYAFNILSLSKQKKYLQVFDMYTHHSDPDIREWAQEANDDLKNELSRTSDS